MLTMANQACGVFPFGLRRTEAPVVPAPRTLVVREPGRTTDALRLMLQTHLKGEVVPAVDVDEALALLRRGGFDLVLTDAYMVGMYSSGFTLIRIARETLRLDIPIIVVTEDNVPEIRTAALAIGADAVVTTPFTDCELMGAIRFLLA